MYTTIAAASAMSTQITTARSIHAPAGGEPGRIVRSGTTANNIAAYQVPNGGWNFLRPVIIWMATNKANVGNVISTRQMPRSKTSGPLALFRVMMTLSGRSEVWLLSPTRTALMSQPSSDPVTSTRAGTY
ncbi:Uncharacterised protein [Mycobacterium tuberculosis]|nr:Uncharacterised protein [Mycobacterium tuberculosis]